MKRTIRQLASLALGLVFAAPVAPALADGGLYMRASLGGSSVNLERSTEGSVSGLGSADLGESRIEGGASAFDVSLGGFTGEHLAVVGTLAHSRMADPVLDPEGSGVDERLPGALDVAFLGAGLDYFFGKRTGFHVGGSLGVAGATAPAPNGALLFDRLGGAGGALSVVVGYDFTLSDRWALGLLVRWIGAGLRGESTQLGITGVEKDRLSMVSLAATVLFR